MGIFAELVLMASMACGVSLGVFPMPVKVVSWCEAISEGRLNPSVWCDSGYYRGAVW